MTINTLDIQSYLQQIGDLLSRYLQQFPEDAERLSVLRQQVDEGSKDLTHRKGLPGHLTASALVLDPSTDSFLLIQHNFLKRWLQPGGHMDACEDPVAAAKRELEEEVGTIRVELHPWQETHAIPLDIDSHQIPVNTQKQEPEHLHHDFQYIFLLEGPAPTPRLQEEEVAAFRWAPKTELLSGTYGRRLARTVEKMKALQLF
jgi:8-oxo-dGTP pyrophosphatase MutT (NUDIX family)